MGGCSFGRTRRRKRENGRSSKRKKRERVRISIRKRATPFIPLVILKMFRLPVDKKIGDNNGVSEVANAWNKRGQTGQQAGNAHIPFREIQQVVLLAQKSFLQWLRWSSKLKAFVVAPISLLLGGRKSMKKSLWTKYEYISEIFLLSVLNKNHVSFFRPPLLFPISSFV